MKNIGKVVREIRKRRNLTQVQLAKKAKIAQGHLSLIESGDVDNVTNETVKSLSKALCVPVSVIEFMALDFSDIQPGKREMFKDLKPATDALINEFFFETKSEKK